MASSTKKKISRKMKNVIRKSLSLVCMSTAVIVAAVPAKEAQGYVPPSNVNYTYGVEPTDKTPGTNASDKLYSDGVDLSMYSSGRITDTSSDTVFPGSGEPDVYKVLNVNRLSDGTYTVNWQFKIYLQQVKGTAMGVICEYNSTYAQGKVTITPSMPYEYVIVSEKEYGDDFYDKFKEACDNASATANIVLANGTTKSMKARYETDYDKFLESPTQAEDQFWIQKYFPERYANYVIKVQERKDYEQKKAQYDIDKADYDAKILAGMSATEPIAPVDPGKPSITCYVDEMTVENKCSYFCDVHPDYNSSSLSLSGYKLVEVADYRSGASSLSMPKVYMPQGEPNPYFSQSSTDSTVTPPPANSAVSKNDALGFRIKNKCLVIAIGDDAFKSTQNVDQLDICKEIKYIGDSAFQDSFVQSVTFQNIKNIGNRAFMGCSRLASINLREGAVNIGTEAFYGCKFENLVFPYSIEYIGPGAFANCTKLSNIDFSNMNRDDAVLDNFSFFDNIALSNVTFSNSITTIGEGAFACAKGVTGNLANFEFPANISQQSGIGNFVLAGRTNLRYVKMPADYGKNSKVTLPYGTFFNCNNLMCVEFPAVGGSCGLVTFGKYTDSSGNERTIFDTVQTQDFYVRGPEFDVYGDFASPRKSTWGLKTNLGNQIPYIYTDVYGKEQYEVSDGEYILIIDDAGVLKSCVLADSSSAASGIDLVIPSMVGETKVSGVDTNCFSDPTIHDNIVSLTISDDSISEISQNAFKNCPRLERVSIGNTVTSIGESAFQNCPKLTYVNFETPVNGYASFPVENIGKNAFSTGADSLVFEGDIDENYGPFAWAMGLDNYVNENNGIRVCYKTGYPTYLTVMVDNRNGYPTLLDYPHYEQIDKLSGTENDEHPLSERYLNLGDEYFETDANGNQISCVYSITLTEEQLINSALNLTVPSGIKSIDSKGYFNNTSREIESISGVHTNTNNVYKYLLGIDNYDAYKNEGLFAGYYGDITDSDGKAREYPEGMAKETKSIGNDRIESISMPSVVYIPDECFLSCENLESVYTGENLENIGNGTFAGCYNLTGVSLPGRKYSCENGILYENNDDGSYTLKEVLSSRGSAVGSHKVNINPNDPNLEYVTAISDGAFYDCDSVTSVDLKDFASLTELPAKCFKDCDRLNQISIPDNITVVGHEAFADCMEGLSVVFYGEEVYLPNDAFKNIDNFKVVSYKDSAVRKAAKDLGADVSETLDYSYKVQFLDYDGSELSPVLYVVEGSDLGITDIPDDPVREGYTFTGWDKPFTNIIEDTFIFAMYKENPGANPGYDPENPDAPLTPASPTPTTFTSTSKGTGKGTGKKTPTSTKETKAPAESANTPGPSSTGAETTPTPTQTSVATPAPQFYTLTVTDGNGSGSYAAGATVIITSKEAPAGQTFAKWVPETNDLAIASVSVGATTMVMPAHNASVAATFKELPTNTSSRSDTSNTAANNNASTPSSNKDNEGTKVVVNKSGISNTGLASASVTGSPDDFVVRITETQKATEEVEEALMNEFGDLDNVRYNAMDISLYDSTGSQKITDYDGLSVTLTVPIPDTLTKYAGNNKVAAVKDGKLEKLNPKYVSIDGVPCITFTAKHFSPYTIYVDITNLSDSTITDATPKTGDSIAPKWFLVFGLGALGIALFFMKDKREINVKAI